MGLFLRELGILQPAEAGAGGAEAGGPLAARVAFGAGAAAGLWLTLAFGPGSLALQGLDAMFYFFTSERAAYGTPPFLSAFSPQNALGVLLPAVGILLGRPFGADALIASRVMTIALYAASVGLVAVLALRLTARRSAALLAGLAYLSFAPLAFTAAAGGQPKNVLAFFVILTLVLVERGRFALAGLAAAGAYLSYQPGLILLPGVLLAAVAAHSPAALGRSLGGFAGGVLVYVSYLALGGALADAFDQTHRYMAASRGGRLPDLSEVYWTWRRIWLAGFGRLNVLPLVGVAGLALVGVLALARLRAVIPAIRGAPVWAALLVSGAGAAAYALLDYGGVPDTYLGLTYVALFSAVFILAVMDRIGKGKLAVLRPPLVALAALGLALVAVRTFQVQRRNALPLALADQRAAAREVGRMLGEGRTVFALGFPYLLAMNHVDNWSIYSSSHSVRPATGYWGYRNPDADFVPVRGGRLPDVILWSRGRPRGWPEWLEARYRRIPSPPLDRLEVQVWEKAPPPKPDSGAAR
jgi:hypothetical protein